MVGVLPVNMTQKGGGLLRFVVVSSQIPTLARGRGGSGFQLISALTRRTMAVHVHYNYCYISLPSSAKGTLSTHIRRQRQGRRLVKKAFLLYFGIF